MFPFWAQSSGWICKVSRRVWLVGEDVCEHPKGHNGSLIPASQTLQETTWKSVMAATWGAFAVLWPPSSLCADSPGPKTIHMRWWGHPLGYGQDNPELMLLPQTNPPLLSLQSPFHSLLTETVIITQRN